MKNPIWHTIMIKKCLMIIIFALQISSASCFLSSNPPSDDSLANNRGKLLIAALNNKDEKALTSMFSANAKTDAKELSDEIHYLMNYYKGTAISTQIDIGASSENINYGKIDKSVDGNISVKTKYDTYCIFFVESWSNYDSKKSGLFQLQILNEQDNGKALFWFLHYDDTPGILCPQMLEPKDYAAAFARALENGDSNGIKDLFSKNAKNKANNFDSNVNAAINNFCGSFISEKLLPATDVSIETIDGETITKGICEITAEKWDEPNDTFIYLIYFEDVRNDTDENDAGLYTVNIVKKENANTQISKIDKAGLFVNNSE